MYCILTDEIRALLKDIEPWVIGTKGGKPIFKDGTPDEIKEKHKRLVELAKKEYGV